MNSKLSQHKTLIIVIAAILIAAIGFGAGMMVRTSRAAEDPSRYIGADRAKQIALENVGVSKPKATFTKVEIDSSGNAQAPCYSLVFHTASTEYRMQIHALDGSVSHKESQDLIPMEDRISAQIQETAETQSSNTEQSSETETSNADSNPTECHTQHTQQELLLSHHYIGVSRAQEIALQHAKVSLDAADITSAHLDSDDGIILYEIEFISNGIEYEYEINAETGTIISFESESSDFYD